MEAALKTVVSNWGVAALTRAGETECGDRYVVQQLGDGAMVAVIDALGHGAQAAQVAETAVRILLQHSAETPTSLIERGHAGLRGTRGATISIARFDWHRHTMRWAGVGNVAGVLVDTATGASPRVCPLLVRGGVVGDHMAAPQFSEMSLGAEGVLIVATDGVHPNFADMLPYSMAPQKLAEYLLSYHATHNDDATVLVFRYGGNY